MDVVELAKKKEILTSQIEACNLTFIKSYCGSVMTEVARRKDALVYQNYLLSEKIIKELVANRQTLIEEVERLEAQDEVDYGQVLKLSSVIMGTTSTIKGVTKEMMEYEEDQERGKTND